jgi:hypothetical protein
MDIIFSGEIIMDLQIMVHFLVGVVLRQMLEDMLLLVHTTMILLLQ